MNENQNKQLRENRVKIVSDLEPKGKVLDTLYEDGVLTENDIELVASAKTRKERCQLLLSILPTRGPVAYGSFKKALEVGQYEFLADQLCSECNEIHQNTDVKTDSDLSSQRRTDTKACQRCWTFLQKVYNERTDINRSLLRIMTMHCCLLLDNIESSDVIDQLFKDHVITADDIGDIVADNTRRCRCETLFKTLLSVQGTSVVESLKLSLMKKYSYIVDKIENGTDDNQPMTQSSRSQTAPNIRKQNSNADVVSDAQASLKARPLVERTVRNSADNIKGTVNVTSDIQLCGKADPYVNNSRNGEKEYSNTLIDSNIHASDKNMTDLKITADINDDTVVKSEVINHRYEIQWSDRTNTVDGAFAVASGGQRLFDTTNTSCEKDNLNESSLNMSFEIPASSSFYSPVAVATKIQAEEKTKFQNSKSVYRKRKHKKRSLAKDIPKLMDVSHKEHDSKTDDRGEIVPKQITTIHSQKLSTRLTMAFNYLSTLINQGEFSKFEETSDKLQSRFPSNYDLMCIIGYLQTSRDLFQTNFDSAKSHIDSTMALVPKTTNPRYFMLELFTAKTRKYITRKKFEKFQTTLDEALMILETDPVGCTGRAAGWLYINDARNKTTQLSCLNLRSPNACQVYEHLFESAKTSFQRSMTNFKRDGGKDGPFGFGYALCRLAILLLRCGDNGLTMNSLTPPADDIHTAGQYLNHLEDSDIAISRILDMHFRLAKCDYQFRRGNFVRALEHAQIGHDLTTELRLFEYKEHAYNRLSFLKSKSQLHCVADELSEEKAQRILFEEPSSSEWDTLNDKSVS
ncbi:uncharacterized protein LOC128556228 [Mercenaria mercenaria]|uniref:uncharacterized protein LOC128556228 n=1 Tax=Mercenaria mercenaria TaxID=6596 RepID=UPI00234FB3A7|nr:uncharacterized protein LOC128556228 [Mercenaria mercenaria]